MKYIDEHKKFGVEPICAVLKDAGVPIAPSTYYAAKIRPPSKRSISDAATTKVIEKLHAENNAVYGSLKVWAELRRRGRGVARCTVERLMRAAGLHGVHRSGAAPRTTVAGSGPDPRADHVERDFTATAPNRLWVADITYIKTHSGWVYAAFVIDVFSRYVVGWQVATHLRTSLALDALEMAIWNRRRAGADLSGLVHHSDRGAQYVAVRYSQRLAEEEAVASVGSRGDSYDNAMAEAFNSLFKAELIRHKGPWVGINDVEIAVAEYLDWFNHRRLHGQIGLVPPAELEADHQATTVAAPAAASETTLH